MTNSAMTKENVVSNELQLRLAKKVLFESFEIECYEDSSRDNGDFLMTRKQIAEALGYEDEKSFHKVVQRKQDVVGFPRVDKLSTVDGKLREVELYTFEQFFELIDGNRQPKAKLFRKWAILTLNELVTGRAELKFKQKSDELAYEANIAKIVEESINKAIKPLHNKIFQMDSTMFEMSKYIEKLNQKHDIFENPISLFARLQTNFNAKIYNRGSDGASAIMDLYSAIRSYTGLHIPYSKNEAKQLGYVSIKDYVIKVFGSDFIKMFDNAILDGRIVRVKSGEFVDLSGVFQNPYEKDKIVKHFTGKSDGIVKCGFCLTNVYVENEDYDFEHLIHKSHPDSSDRIENLIIACKSCNKDKGGQTFEEWYPTSDVFTPNRQSHIQKHIDKYSTNNQHLTTNTIKIK